MSVANINFLSMLERPVAFHRVFVDLTGCANAALLLSQVFYWHPRSGKEDWFHKTAEEWNQEIGLSVRELETARRMLVNLGVIQYRRAGMPAKPYYRLDHERLNALLAAIYNARNVDASYAENAEQDTRNTHNMLREKRAAKRSETTAETTETTFANAQVVEPTAKKPGRKTAMPEGFSPNATHRQIADEEQVSLPEEFVKFCDYHAANASRYADWDAALRTWLRNAAKFARSAPAARRAGAAAFDPVAYVNQNRVGPRPGLQSFEGDPFAAAQAEMKVVNP